MYSETTKREKKARKVHICNECETEIEKGSVYIGNSSVIEGRYEPMRRHSDCIEAAELLEAEGLKGGTYGRFFLKVMIERNPEVTPQLDALLIDFPDVLERLK